MTYGDLNHQVGGTQVNIGKVVEDLTSTRGPTSSLDQGRFHLRLARYQGTRCRAPLMSSPGWWGRGGAQEGHLRKQGVDKDDIFLFFGAIPARRRGFRTVAICPLERPSSMCCSVWLQVGAVSPGRRRGLAGAGGMWPGTS